MISATYNSDKFESFNLAKTAGSAILAGNEVKFGADTDKFALSSTKIDGIGIATEAAASASTDRQDIILYGSGGVVKVVQDGTAVAGKAAVSGGNGKFTVRPADATTTGTLAAVPIVRGIFLETSAVDGALVMLKLI